MASTIEDLVNLRVYNKQVYLPVNNDNRKEGSAIYLMTPTFGSSLDFLSSVFAKGRRRPTFLGSINWKSYYMEKSLMYYVNNESHKMSRLGDQVIEEDGDLKLKPKEKGKLSEFKRVEIDEHSMEDHLNELDKINGIVEYFPWTGYFYLTEGDKLVAGVNVNVEDKFIQKIFVTEEKYSYLYDELIAEARKMKANTIVVDKTDGCKDALTKFGFSVVEDYTDRVKMQYKIPIEESVKIYGADHGLYTYVSGTYKPKGKYNADLSDSVLKIGNHYCKRLGLNYNISYLMGRCFLIPDVTERLINDANLDKWMSHDEILTAVTAINDMGTPDGVMKSIYSRLLHDAEMMSHYTDLDVAIGDAVKWYFDEYELEPRDYLFTEEVPIIEERLRRVHREGGVNGFILKLSYTYYREHGGSVQKAAKKGPTAMIMRNYHVRPGTQNDEVATLLQESHISFGFQDESFSNDLSYQPVNSMYGYHIDGVPKGTRGIVIREGHMVQGVVRVNEENTITDLYASKVSPNFMIMLANRKYLANKAIVPRESTVLIDAFDKSPEWSRVSEKGDKILYDLAIDAEYIPYPDIGIDEETKTMWYRLDNEAKSHLGNQYLNESCPTNTIYRRVYNEIGLIDLYVIPTFPKVAWVDVAVLESARGKGNGSMMVRECVDYVKKNLPKIDILGWSCNAANTASYNLALKNEFVPHSIKNNQACLFRSINTLTPNVFAEESDYTEDDEWSSRDINLEHCIHNDGRYMMLEEDVINEAKNGKLGNQFRRMMWDDRIRADKDVLGVYSKVKAQIKNIQYTFLDLNQYKKKNLFIDLSFYINSFIENIAKAGQLNERKINDLFYSLLIRMIRDNRISQNYKKKMVCIPIDDWVQNKVDIKFGQYLNPCVCLEYMLEHRPELVKSTLKDYTLLFISEIGFVFKLDINEYDKTDLHKYRQCYRDLVRKVDVPEDKSYSKEGLMHVMLDKLEDNGNKSIKINSIKAEAIEDEDKKKLVKKIEKAAEQSSTPEDAAKKVDEEDEYTDKLLDSIVNKETGNQDISATRSKRMDQLCKQFLDSKVVDNNVGFKGTMADYMELNANNNELPETALPFDSINDEDWKHMQFNNFGKVYNLRSDIYRVLYHFNHVTCRLGIREKIDIKDTSTTEDWKETWTVPFENQDGKRFSFKFDLPILKDNRFMVLGGNDKTINGQLVLLPVSKTDDDTVQFVSNYNKIFIRRYSTGDCRSNRHADILAKAIESCDNIKAKYGNSVLSNNHYSLPYDYIDLSSKYYSIQLVEHGKILAEFYFSQDNAHKELNLPKTDKMPIGWVGSKSKVIYFEERENSTCAGQILEQLCLLSKKVDEEVMSIKPSPKHYYANASVLATDIPVIVLMAFSEGLQMALKKGHIKYQLSEKRIDSLKKTHGVIKFKDCYLYYEDNYNSSILMNGLKEVPTEAYSIKQTDDKSMWTECMDEFGGRIKADGLDNFYDLMMDPITVEVCRDYNLPTDYCEMLAYASILLTNNEYIKHTDIRSNRYRTNELVAAHAYKCIAKAYANYRIQRKKQRTGVIMTMKQSAILDSLAEDSTMSDLSILNPLLEYEAASTVSFKGLVGMNSDRAYSLDKRTYGDTMINKVALSTGFAGNVGVNRQTTINMQIKGTRGYIKNSSLDECTTARALSMTEALTPFGSTRDDPFRTAMTNIQTSKHNMRIKQAAPLLVSCGADKAIAYLTGDEFAFKAKAPGKVIRMNKDFMVVQYDYNPHSHIKEKYTEIVDLRENIKKNSDGGFYITVKLDTNLKTGSRFKTNDILAYDHQVYSTDTGDGSNISFCIGALGNIAYINTDEGIEDSAIISNRLAEALSSEVVVMISKNLPANTNIFSIVEKGAHVQEGDTLLLYQSPFDEEDANAIVKSLSLEKDEVSEMGRIPIKSKVTGIVQDIKIYRTVEYSEMSSSLRSIVKKHEQQLQPIADAEKLANNKIDVDPTYKLPPVSKMKNCENKVKIEFYLKYNDKMGIGDKLVFMSAIKGETKNIFPIGQEPYTDRAPSEIIDSLCPLPSVLHRMVASVKILTGLYKGVIEVTRQMKEALSIPYIPYNPKPKQS